MKQPPLNQLQKKAPNLLKNLGSYRKCRDSDGLDLEFQNPAEIATELQLELRRRRNGLAAGDLR
jgi:hypothetical protein